MRFFKKFYLIFILIMLVTINSVILVDGVDTFYDDTKTAGYQQIENLDTRSFYNGILYQKNLGQVLTSSGTEQVSYGLLTGSPSEDTKVVTWAYQANDNSFQRASLSAIAQDYESKHPGWKVMGLTNADQFTLGRGSNLNAEGKDPYIYQPYYPYIADGEKYFSIRPTAGGGSFVGITNEGNDPLIQVSANLDQIVGLKLTVYDSDNTSFSKYSVKYLNETPHDGEVAIYSPYYTDINGTIPNVTASGSTVFFVGKADLAYVSNTKKYAEIFKGTPKETQSTDAFYGKGKISEVGTNYSVGKGQFAIVSNNEELNEILKVGGLVRGQYEYINENFNSFESGIGFHTVQKDNGKDGVIAGTYNTSKRPRSLIGRKVDGTTCLLVIDDYLNSYGTTSYGINAILKKEGIIEAYQMDGGGSAQMYVRENDKFIPVTKSADYPNQSQQRIILNALLFVVRTEDVSHEWISSSLREINLKINLIESYGKDIQKLYVHLNNQYYLVGEDGNCKITNLSVDTEFKYDIYSENSFGEKNKTIYSGVVKTAKPAPEFIGFSYEINNDKISFIINIKDAKEAVIGEYLTVDGKNATKKDGKYTFPLELLKGVPVVICNYNLNDGNGVQTKQFYLFGQINLFMGVDSLLIKQKLIVEKILKN